MIRYYFGAAKKIKSILLEGFNKWYILASFDVESLFTNALFQRTVDVILDQVYSNKIIQTQLKK